MLEGQLCRLHRRDECREELRAAALLVRIRVGFFSSAVQFELSLSTSSVSVRSVLHVLKVLTIAFAFQQHLHGSQTNPIFLDLDTNTRELIESIDSFFGERERIERKNVQQVKVHNSTQTCEIAICMMLYGVSQ